MALVSQLRSDGLLGLPRAVPIGPRGGWSMRAVVRIVAYTRY